MDTYGKQAEMAVSYRYDPMNRLTNEDRNGAGERYAYDLCGNRLPKEQYRNGSVDVTEGYRYNERNELTERIKAGRLTAYHYDKNGSIISEEEEGRRSEYRYDLLNRQTYVRTLDGREQENLYDGENLRAGLTENGKKTSFLYHNGEILTEFDGESAPIRRHIRGIGLSCVQTAQDNAYHSYHQDEQGSTVYVTGQENTVQNCYQYDAFGNLLEKREDVSNRILYTGQQYDQETGQYYLRARYYNPVVGRFLQEDTYRGDGLNLYAYCANNPVVYYDPSGHNCDGQGQNEPPKSQGKQAITEGDSNIVKNWKGEDVKIPDGHTMSPRDPDFSVKPITEAGPYTSTQRDEFLSGNSAGTKLAPHHRHQIPVRDGGVIDELPGPGHPSGNQHTGGSPSRHPAKSIFNSEPGGNTLRNDEIKQHWKDKGNRLVEIEPGVWIDPGV